MIFSSLFNYAFSPQRGINTHMGVSVCTNFHIAERKHYNESSAHVKVNSQCGLWQMSQNYL